MKLDRTSRLFALLALAFPLVTAACDDDDEKNLTPFIGTWTIASGQLQPAAGCVLTTPLPLTGGTVTVAKSTTGGDLTVNLVGCTTNYTVSGRTATIIQGQSCMSTITAGGFGTIMATLTPNVGTLALVTDTTATFNGGGAAASTALNCNYTITNASLVKGTVVGPDGGTTPMDAAVKNDSGTTSDGSVKNDTNTPAADSGVVHNDASADGSHD